MLNNEIRLRSKNLFQLVALESTIMSAVERINDLIRVQCDLPSVYTIYHLHWLLFFLSLSLSLSLYSGLFEHIGDNAVLVRVDQHIISDICSFFYRRYIFGFATTYLRRFASNALDFFLTAINYPRETPMCPTG